MALIKSEVIKWFVEHPDTDFSPSSVPIVGTEWRWVAFDGRTPHLMNENDLSTITAGDIARARLDALVDAKRDHDSCETESIKMAGNKYQRNINGVAADIYDILTAWDVRNPSVQHAIKKLLQPGARGHKDVITDLQEAQASIAREIELEQRNEQN